MWTRVTSLKVAKGREKRASFGVTRGRTGFQAAQLIIPDGATPAPRATVYSDGNGKIAFSFGEKGDFKLSGKTTKRVAIPRQLAHLIPFGTHDAVLSNDGGMLVLDTKQFRTTAVAA